MFKMKRISRWACKQCPKLLCGLIPVLFLTLAVLPFSFAGVNAMPHLRLGAGARSIGLGGAFTAIADDATATVWNPAGLGSVKDLSFNLSTQRLSLDRSHNFMAVSKSIGLNGAIGFAVTNAGVADIAQYDKNEAYMGNINYSANAYSLSYGHKVGSFNLGLSARMLMDNFGTESVENQSGFGGVDVGFMGHAMPIKVGEQHVPTFHYGIVAKYLGASLGDDTVPMVIDIGVAYNLYMGNIVTFAADMEQELVALDESTTSLRFGAEYTIVDYKSTAFALRAGVRASRDTQNLFGGFGVNIGGLQIDYAMQDGMSSEINGVGTTHFASLSYEF